MSSDRLTKYHCYCLHTYLCSCCHYQHMLNGKFSEVNKWQYCTLSHSASTMTEYYSSSQSLKTICCNFSKYSCFSKLPSIISYLWPHLNPKFLSLIDKQINNSDLKSNSHRIKNMQTSTIPSNILKIKNMIDDSRLPHSLYPNIQDLISISHYLTSWKLITYFLTYFYLLNLAITYLLSQFFSISSVWTLNLAQIIYIAHQNLSQISKNSSQFHLLLSFITFNAFFMTFSHYYTVTHT